jgi:hypothetical protein
MRKLVILVVFGILMVFAAFNNVSSAYNRDDAEYFRSLGFVEKSRPSSQAEQILTIREVQNRVLQMVPMGEGYPLERDRQVRKLVAYGSGQCYDRSRILELLLQYVGFETRYVFLVYRDDYQDNYRSRTFLEAFLTRGSQTHAAVEVKTNNGWLFVDSNSPWIAETRTGEVVNANEVSQRLNGLQSPPPHVVQRWWVVPGLYSRSGAMYPPYWPFPDLNIPMFTRGLLPQ